MAEQVTAAQLVEDLYAVIRDAEALLGATASHAGEQIDEARERAEASVRAAKARLSTIESDLLERATAFADDADRLVRAHPWEAAAIAVGVGLVLGLLINRR